MFMLKNITNVHPNDCINFISDYDAKKQSVLQFQ